MEPTTQPSTSAPVQPSDPALIESPRPSRLPIIVISLLFIGALAFTYYFYNKSIQYEAEMSQQKADSVVALLEVKKKLAELQPQTASEVVASSASSSSELSENIVVSGVLEWNDMLQDACFNVSDKDAYKIPRSKDDERSAWFCFRESLPSDLIEKLKARQENGLPLTIEINNYFVWTQASGGSDLVDFVRIVP